MIRFLLAFVVAGSAAAQTADLRVTITASQEAVQPLTVIPYSLTVENLGPNPATDVVFEGGAGNELCTSQKGFTLAAGERRSVTCSTVAPVEYATAIAVSASSAVADPDPTNNLGLVRIRIITPPDLYVHSFPPDVVDAGLPFPLTVHYGNLAHTDAHDVTLTITGHFANVARLPERCTHSAGTITCRLGNLPARPLEANVSGRQLELELIAPDASAQQVPLVVQIRATNEDDFRPESNVLETSTRTYRTYFVTNPGDAGSGTLRNAIETANADCAEAGYCKIAFRIPPATTRWLTITPATPLPRVVAPAIAIDAHVAARYFAETNADGPEIELSGSRVTAGHGLEIACGGAVRGFAINGFPGSGIHVTKVPCATDGGRPSESVIESNYLGTDPTGMTAVPNLRGVTFDNGGSWSVRANVISGNLRAGVFVERSRVVTQANVIGLNRTVTAGLGNGASGVYLGDLAGGSDVVDNYIGFNAHAGVSLHPHMTYSAIFGNSFQANHSLAIDFGLDGATREVPDESTRDHPVRRPVIESAHYDASRDETVVEGTSDTYRDRHEVWVYVYGNDAPDPSGYGEGQYFLGGVKADLDGRFTFRMKGRPAGRWIAATTTRINIIGFARTPETQFISGSGVTATTSEFGRTVELQ